MIQMKMKLDTYTYGQTNQFLSCQCERVETSIFVGWVHLTHKARLLTGYKETINNATTLTVPIGAANGACETRVMRKNIKDLEALTCNDVGLDCQSHYAHQCMPGAVVHPSIPLGQLWGRRIKTMS